MLVWTVACGAAALFCIVRGIVDLRARKYAWGTLGIVSGAILLLMPVQTHAVSIDLPVDTAK